MKTVARYSAILAGVLLLLVAIMTTVDVALRYLFNRPWEGSLEVVENTYVFIVFLGFASEIMERREIRVDIFTTRAKGPAYLLFEAISLAASAALFAVLIWYGASNWLRAFAIHDVGMGALRIPTTVPWGGIVIGSFVAFCAVIARIVHLARNPFTPPPAPAPETSIE